MYYIHPICLKTKYENRKVSEVVFELSFLKIHHHSIMIPYPAYPCSTPARDSLCVASSRQLQDVSSFFVQPHHHASHYNIIPLFDPIKLQGIFVCDKHHRQI